MHEGVQDWLHELIVQRRQDVVVQLNPLEAVQVLECRCWDVFDPENKRSRCASFNIHMNSTCISEPTFSLKSTLGA